MKTFVNKISESQRIYKSQASDSTFKTWPFKKTKCRIYLYEDVSCSDIDTIICSTLYLHDGVLSVDDLATILGFNVKDDFSSNPIRYKDEAEVAIFNNLLSSLKSDELINVDADNIQLTTLGEFAVRNTKKRLFYSAECKYYENFSLKQIKEEQFPFRDALALTTQVEKKQRISFYKQLSSYDIIPEVKDDERILVEALLQQVPSNTNLFSANLLPNDFVIESEKIDIAVYNDQREDFVIIYSNDGSISENASELINAEVNSNVKSIKVEWGYYLRLLNDPNAKLDSEALKPFEDIIEWEVVVKDNRFCWDDSVLFRMLCNNIDANIWHDVSSLCPISDVKKYLKFDSVNWDWSILSARFDGDFITEYAYQYPWDFDIIIHNDNVSKENLQQLLTNPHLTSVQWLWKEIMPSLSDEFVIQHIDDVDFDLSIITKKNQDVVKGLILDYPDKSWDWAYISDAYDLNYILENIELLSKRLNLKVVTTRALSTTEFSKAFCRSDIFKKELKNSIASSHTPFNVNTSNLIWDYECIDFLEEVGALTWCVPIVGGFECNQFIIWDKSFFNHYSNRINTAPAYNAVTSRVSDFTIVEEYPKFPWNWDIISSKKEWIADTLFVKRHIKKLDLRKSFDLFLSDTFCALFDNEDIQNFLLSHPETKARATELATIQLVRENFSFDWDWNLLTSKTVDFLKIDKLGDTRWAEKWNWQILSSRLPVDKVSDYIAQYQSYWDWTILSRRLPKSTILEHLTDFADKWDWKILIDEIFDKEDLCIEGFLPTIATIINQKDEDIQPTLWGKITRRFNLEELYDQINKSNTLKDYSSLFQWDLLYVYDHEEFNLNEYVEQYSDDIDWELLSKSKSAERLFYYDKGILSFKLWLEMVKSLLYNDEYCWDFITLSQNESINWHPAILKIRRSQWDWQYLSQFSRCFASHPKDENNIIKNIQQFKDNLDFNLLSKREDVKFSDLLLNTFLEEDWNWKSISASKKLNISNSFLIDNQDKDWDWDILSQGGTIAIDKELLEHTKNRPWNWTLLSSNNSLKMTIAELLSLGVSGWDWKTLSGRMDILFDNDSILSTVDKSYISWDWNLLSSRSDLQYTEDFVLKIYDKSLDWHAVSRMNSFCPTINVLSKLSSFDLDWDAISQNHSLSKDVLWPYREKLNWQYISQNETFQNLGLDFFVKYKLFLDWTIISASKAFTPSIDNLKEFKDCLDWSVINERKDLKYTNLLLNEFSDYINWTEASKANTIDFSVELIRKYIDRWDWTLLFNNPLIKEKAEIYESAFKDKLNGIKFIERFSDSNPKIYHFAHLFNALNIIKSRKILSRIGGKGLFENSAGSNVHRRDTAHHYARFYYRPQTPTQYYNESLGEDSHSSKEKWVFGGYDSRGKKIWSSYFECPTSKYWGAQRLGSPKCPMPVFFEFDLREVLNKCLDKCYYSTGNMQKDNSLVISVADNPNKLNTANLYATIEDGIDTYKAYSQQEFLVWNELDFSQLESYRIICYNEEQAELLKMQLGNDPICNHITTDSYTDSGINVFHRTNRTISVEETEEDICFSTNYRDPSSIIIECEDIDKLEITDKSNITDISKGKIQAYPSISLVKPSIPITVRFMDLQKYASNSWVIYSNGKEIRSSKTVYSIITSSLINNFRLEVSKLNIQISKSLFKDHMLYSYHGIAHTMRVMLNAFIIANIDNSVNEAQVSHILYAALIHDLGKQSDTEGEVHGENSAKLYKEKTLQLFDNHCAFNILEAVKYHSIDDSKCPILVLSNKIWEILKDADALDRSRLPGKGCNPSFLRNHIFASKKGKELLALASLLPSLTEECSWDSPIEELCSVLESLKISI